jgi:hypothetical protein
LYFFPRVSLFSTQIKKIYTPLSSRKDEIEGSGVEGLAEQEVSDGRGRSRASRCKGLLRAARSINQISGPENFYSSLSWTMVIEKAGSFFLSKFYCELNLSRCGVRQSDVSKGF